MGFFKKIGKSIKKTTNSAVNDTSQAFKKAAPKKKIVKAAASVKQAVNKSKPRETFTVNGNKIADGLSVAARTTVDGWKTGGEAFSAAAPLIAVASDQYVPGSGKAVLGAAKLNSYVNDKAIPAARKGIAKADSRQHRKDRAEAQQVLEKQPVIARLPRHRQPEGRPYRPNGIQFGTGGVPRGAMPFRPAVLA
jgi:hypothetical protein